MQSHRFGKTGAFCHVVMQTSIENSQSSFGPHGTKEQARNLLGGLRAAYWSLPLPERSLFRSAILQMSREQSGLETNEEKACFASVL